MAETGAVPTDLVDADRLDQWIGAQLPGHGERLLVERFGAATGTGNALFLLRRVGHAWVMRRPPAVVNAPGANDMMREWRVLRALDGTPVPHPAPLLLCSDDSVCGAPFLIQEFVDGFNPGGELEPPFDTDIEARHAIGIQAVDGIAELSMVDWRSRGLEGFGKPEGFLERQVSRWLAQFESYRTRDIKHLDEVATWLEANQPEMGEPAIIHGDYSLFNTLFAHGAPARLAAIIDWDTATVGDPLLDLGKLLVGWVGDGDEPLIDRPYERDMRGFAGRDDLVSRYERRTGRRVDHIDYYEVLALFKLACILEGHYAQAVRGIRAASQITEMGELVPTFVRSAARLAARS